MWKTISFFNSTLVHQLILYTLSCFQPSLFSTTLVHWMFIILINTHLFIGLIPCRRCVCFMEVAMVIAPRPNYQHIYQAIPFSLEINEITTTKKALFTTWIWLMWCTIKFSCLTWLTMFVLVINCKNSNVSLWLNLVFILVKTNIISNT